MTELTITYHMHNDFEDAESCITLPMKEPVANSLLLYGADSYAVSHSYASRGGEIYQILNALAKIQGYCFDEFVCAHEVNRDKIDRDIPPHDDEWER